MKKHLFDIGAIATFSFIFLLLCVSVSAMTEEEQEKYRIAWEEMIADSEARGITPMELDRPLPEKDFALSKAEVGKEKSSSLKTQKSPTSLSMPMMFFLALCAYSFFKIFLYDKQPLPVLILVWLYVAFDHDLWVTQPEKQSFMQMLWGFPGCLIGVWIWYLWKEAIDRTGKLFGI